MAKSNATKPKTELYGLRFGHPNVFRRTVDIGTKANPKKVQLMFEPDTPLELTDKEIDGLQAEIESGFIVPWGADGKRRRVAPNPTPPVDLKPLQDENAALRSQVEKLTNQVGDLTQQLEDATAPQESDDESEIDDADAPLGDE